MLGYLRNHNPCGLVRVLGAHELEAAVIRMYTKREEQEKTVNIL